jgi:hypothetical protein
VVDAVRGKREPELLGEASEDVQERGRVAAATRRNEHLVSSTDPAFFANGPFD